MMKRTIKKKSPHLDLETSKESSSSSDFDEINSSSDCSSDDHSSEEELVCLGTPENVPILIEEDEKCLVCDTEGHSGTKCKVKCLQCSQSSYAMQIVCTHCGQTYPRTGMNKTLSTLNPFDMFMQYMQFCITLYKAAGAEMYPVTEPIAHHRSTQAFEDIPKTKRERKKVKSGLKPLRKKKKSEKKSDSDSDGSSMATTSTKKRRIHFSTEQPQIPPIQPQPLPPFAGSFPGIFPFAAGGYNMLAFKHMMGNKNNAE